MKYSSTSKVAFVEEATVFSYFFKGNFFLKAADCVFKIFIPPSEVF